MSTPTPRRHTRRAVLLGAGTALGAASVTPSSARVARAVHVGRVATSTDEWVRLWDLPAESPQGAPLAADETVFVPAGSVVRAVDPETGDAAWARPLPAPVSEHGLSATRRTLFAATEDGTVRAFDAADGSERWEHTVENAPIEGVAAAGGRVVVQASNALVALDATDGSVAWTAPVRESPDGRTVAPAATDSTVVGRDGGSVVARSPLDGSERWVQDRPADDPVRCLGIHAEGVVVGGERTTSLLTSGDGGTLWIRPAGATALCVTIPETVVAMGTTATVSLDPESGGERATIEVGGAPGGGIAAGDVEPHGTTVVCTGTADGAPAVIVAEPASGAVLWRLVGDPGNEGFVRAVLSDERLVVQDLEAGSTVAFGEPAKEATAGTEADTGSAGGDTGRDRSGPGLDTTIAIVSLVVTIIGGGVAVAEYLQNRNG